MHHLRTFLSRHRALATLVIAAALCMKALMPAGFMVGQNSKVLTVQICDDGSGHAIAKQLVIPMKDDGHVPADKASKGDCPFASLSMATVSGADPALLVLALAFLLMLGFAPTPILQPKRVSYLRPPLRGPPALT